MERLTEKHYLGTDHYMKCSENCHVDMDCIDCPSLDRLVERHAAYEDTELTPEEVSALIKDWLRLCTTIRECGGIDRLRTLAEADKDGRVVVSCWIPVTERLPEDSVKECIIFVPHIPENIVGLGRYLGAGRWVLDGWYLTPEAVAYWMPLPEAPHKKALEAMKDV
jgi:hypothetical protein